MYNCDVSSSSNQGIRPTNRPSYQKPNRPNIAGPVAPVGGGGSVGPAPSGGGYTNPLAQVIGGIGSFFQALGGKHDETEQFNDDNKLDD